MKQILSLLVASLLFLTTQAQTKKEHQVQNAVEQLRKAMIDGDSLQLSKLVSERLSYGHSGGHIDDKKEFLHKLSSGKSDFVTMDLTDQTVSVFRNTAIVRHTLTAKTNDSGKPGDVHLLVMLVWQKSGGRWHLLARQAVKPS